jgi:hypothetical protein
MEQLLQEMSLKSNHHYPLLMKLPHRELDFASFHECLTRYQFIAVVYVTLYKRGDSWSGPSVKLSSSWEVIDANCAPDFLYFSKLEDLTIRIWPIGNNVVQCREEAVRSTRKDTVIHKVPGYLNCYMS